MHKLLKATIFIFWNLLVAFSLLEGFFRYYFYRWNTNQSVPFLIFGRSFSNSQGIKNFIIPSSTDGIFFELAPNIRSTFLDKPFATNNQNILGVMDYSYDKPANTIRIVGIGDSIMSSWGNSLEDTYLAVLEKKLGEYVSPKKVQIINLSVPGYNTAIEKNVIEKKALKYHPDFIILGFCGNDMELPNYIRRQVHAKLYTYLVIKYIYQNLVYSYLNYAHKQAGNNEIGMLEDAPGDIIQDPNTPFKFASKIGEVPKQYEYMIGLDNYKQLMKNIADISKDNKIPILLIAYTDILNKVPELTNLGFHLIVMDNKVTPYLKDHNLSYEDIQVGHNDFHLNKLGHSLYSNFLYEYIINDHELNYILKSN